MIDDPLARSISRLHDHVHPVGIGGAVAKADDHLSSDRVAFEAKEFAVTRRGFSLSADRFKVFFQAPGEVIGVAYVVEAKDRSNTIFIDVNASRDSSGASQCGHASFVRTHERAFSSRHWHIEDPFGVPSLDP